MGKNREIKHPYFKSISLTNIRSFGSKQTIELNPRWNIITGENGTGKTTVLKALALPLFFQEQWEKSLRYFSQEDFRRNGGTQKSEINYEIESISEHNKFHLFPTFESVISYKNNKSFTPLNIQAFGAVRPISKKGITSEQEFPAFTLFEENNTIWNPEEWLILSNYKALRDTKYRPNFEKIEEAIKNIIPDITEIRYPKEGRTRVEFKTPYGWVEYHQLSLGTRTLTAILIEFMDRLIQEFNSISRMLTSPNMTNPFEMSSILIIDEADSHLFPVLMKSSFKYLEDTFTNTQFIIATNNLILLELAKEFTTKKSINVIRLLRNGNEIKVEKIASKKFYDNKYNSISSLYIS